MIGGLQGDFGDIDIKYLKQNISKCRSQISGSFKRKPRHCAKWLRNSSGKRYQQIRICLSGEVEMPSSPIRRLIRMWNIRRWWNVTRTEFRMWDIWRRWNVTRRSSVCAWCRDPSGATPSGFPKRARGACDSFPIQRKWHVTQTEFRMWLWQRNSKLRFFVFLRFPLLCHGFQRTLLNLGLLWWSNY